MYNTTLSNNTTRLYKLVKYHNKIVCKLVKHHDKVVQACQAPQQGCTSLSNNATRLYKLVKHHNKVVQACQTTRQGCTSLSNTTTRLYNSINKLVTTKYNLQQTCNKVVTRLSFLYGCPCAKYPGPAPPSFVGDHYYCESGNTGTFDNSQIYDEDPLWDGEGCGTGNNCCAQPGMPWFCCTLPQEVDGDIEVRLCANQDTNDEDLYLELLEIYLQ